MDGDYELMPLTDEQWTKMYDMTLANSTHIEWIRLTLTNTIKDVKECNDRVLTVETDQAFMRGKMARFAGGVAAVCAIAVNGILWAFGHLGAK